MLRVEDAERLMGLPAGWTEPCYPLRVPGKPNRTVDYNYAALVVSRGAGNGRSDTGLTPGDAEGRGGGAGGGGGGETNPPLEHNKGRRLYAAQSLNDFNAATAKRFEKLGIAVAVPQARWIGERLANPYDLKFARAGDAVKFAAAIPGGRLPNAGRLEPAIGSSLARLEPSEMDDFISGSAASVSGWPDAAYNVDPRNSGWRGRRSLPSCGDAPVIRGFVPLGEFLGHDLAAMPECPVEVSRAYVRRLRLDHVEIEPFVAHGLGETRAGNRIVARDGGVTQEDGGIAVTDDGGVAVTDDVEGTRTRSEEDKEVSILGSNAGLSERVPAGRVVWAPASIGKTRQVAYWPSLALHAHDDRDAIPTRAFDALKPGISPETHCLIVYFGDKTYDWTEMDGLLNYAEHVDDFSDQPALKNRARFRRGLGEAREWHEEQVRLGQTPASRAAAHARARAEENLRRAVGANGGDGGSLREPASCGACLACRDDSLAARVVPFSKRHLSRACAEPSAVSEPPNGARGRERPSRCPQIDIIREARKGHVGACVSLLRERAIGRRVAVHWADERRRFRGTVAGFDPERYTHAVRYDDGDVEPGSRLWKECVSLAVAEDAEADREARAGAGPSSPPREPEKRGSSGAFAIAVREPGSRDPKRTRVTAGVSAAPTPEKRPKRHPGRPPTRGRGTARGRNGSREDAACVLG
jgi:hypothetical protein